MGPGSLHRFPDPLTGFRSSSFAVEKKGQGAEGKGNGKEGRGGRGQKRRRGSEGDRNGKKREGEAEERKGIKNFASPLQKFLRAAMYRGDFSPHPYVLGGLNQ